MKLSSLDALLTPAQAARWLQLSPRGLSDKVRAGRIPAIRLGYRKYRFHPRTILAALTTEPVTHHRD